MFGYEDKLLTNIAVWPIWWKLNDAETKIRPVHVLDVAQALSNLLTMHKHSGVLNLPGPSTLTYEYLLDLVDSVTLRPPSKAPVLPKRAAELLSEFGKTVWWPVLSKDEVARRYINDSEVAGDWATVGVEPSEIEDHAITYLRRYRSAYGPFFKRLAKFTDAGSAGPTLSVPCPSPHVRWLAPLVRLESFHRLSSKLTRKMYSQNSVC